MRSVDPDTNAADVLDAIDLGNHDASAASYWTLDPVDGTKGFLRGGQYAISLAFIENGKVTFGVLGCPNLSADFARPFNDPDPQGCLYVATDDQAAWYLPIENPNAKPEPIKVSATAPIEQLRLL